MRGLCRKIVVLLLISVIFITGCGSDPAEDAQASPEAETTEHEKAVKVEDGTMSADSTVIAVGQTPVTYREYQCYYYFMENQYDSLLGSDVWKQRGDSDKTIGQEAIEDVLRLIIQVKVVVKQAATLGVALEADEKEDADYNAQKIYDELSEDVRHTYMITAALLMKIFEENRLTTKVYHVITGQAGETISAAESQAYRVQLLYKAAGTDRETVRTEMDSFQKTIAASDKSFYYYARQESELPEVENIVGALDERKNLWNTVSALKIGTVSPVIEEENGFYLAYVLEKPNDTINTEYQNKIVADRQITSFQDKYREWSGFYDVAVSDLLLSD